ncbi:hypothetical protein MGG_16958 [Pyricularia oryzae 70-15]|uniref:Uncharacterized protein n=1 Tax=Pyricularia oryzae (strain 70-15 / ATCC MYA-4617 / FGSC 8958) TaxID=242507 RepID=G4N218_PYRO7|nr:uncharacterized protein MGG_16958 [Pyricularia oryzae 70-15]EHA53328.1 hypothetical protein MGG_16958 [Pyricularia oryzae 70-15]
MANAEPAACIKIIHNGRALNAIGLTDAIKKQLKFYGITDSKVAVVERLWDRQYGNPRENTPSQALSSQHPHVRVFAQADKVETLYTLPQPTGGSGPGDTAACTPACTRGSEHRIL